MYPQTDSLKKETVLVGWKEIATFLHASVRSVQRYEQEFGLPVRRTCGKSRAAVMARAAELEAWVATRPKVRRVKLPPMVGDFAAYRDLREGLVKMRELRAEMMHLRLELRATIEALRSSIHISSPEPRRFSRHKPKVQKPN